MTDQYHEIMTGTQFRVYIRNRVPWFARVEPGVNSGIFTAHNFRKGFATQGFWNDKRDFEYISD